LENKTTAYDSIWITGRKNERKIDKTFCSFQQTRKIVSLLTFTNDNEISLMGDPFKKRRGQPDEILNANHLNRCTRATNKKNEETAQKKM
jgi:hypothetical protein